MGILVQFVADSAFFFLVPRVDQSSYVNLARNDLHLQILI